MQIHFKMILKFNYSFCNNGFVQEAIYCTPWQSWSACSRTCQGGYRQRNRQCSLTENSKQYLGSNTAMPLICQETLVDIESCGTISCNGWLNTAYNFSK